MPATSFKWQWPHCRSGQYLRADNGGLPEEDVPRTAAASMADASESPPLPQPQAGAGRQ